MNILFFAAMLFAHQHTAEMQFKEMQDEGTIVYEGNDIETGQAMFTIFLPDTTINYAYKGEVMEYINSGTFEYNDFLK